MPTGYSTWTNSLDGNRSCEIWYGEQEQVEWYDPATTPWEELYHEEDFRGIAYQFRAEELGFA